MFQSDMSNVGHVGFVSYPAVLLITGDRRIYQGFPPCYNEKGLNSIQANNWLHKIIQILLLVPNLTLPIWWLSWISQILLTLNFGNSLNLAWHCYNVTSGYHKNTTLLNNRKTEKVWAAKNLKWNNQQTISK